MTPQELKATLTTSEIEQLQAVCIKQKEITDEEVARFRHFINEQAVPALGDDQIAEPIRYIVASVGGLRGSDLKALIGDGFDEAVFEAFNNCLGFPLLPYRQAAPDVHLYDLHPAMRNLLRDAMGHSSYRSCASDIGYHLLEHCQPGDVVRDMQTMHLLLDGGEAAAAAEYLSAAEGEALRMAVLTMGQALKDGPDDVKECVWDMTRAEGEKISLNKILLLLLNDAVAIVGQPDLQRPVTDRLHSCIESLIAGGRQDITVLLGIAKLRQAQNARVRRDEQEAQQRFIGALNYLMPPLQQADPLTITSMQLEHYWLALKICQEMAQPKAMVLLFDNIVKTERAQAMNESVDEDDRVRLSERILSQHIDMSKLYYALPKPLQEQFTNYTEQTIQLLNAFLQNAKEAAGDADPSEVNRLAGYYQALGELCNHMERYEESYDALTEAQILQMRQLAALQRRDGNEVMSPDQLIMRLALSVTNHLLAAHYRRQHKDQHELRVLLTSNLDLAIDCFRHYPQDARVIHFIINAALELGDDQHKSKGLLAECGTYEKVLRQLHALQNMRLDLQLCQDVAMIHTKAGQVQADKQIRRYGEALKNFDIALRLWDSLAQNTKNADFQKNADALRQMIAQLKGNKK